MERVEKFCAAEPEVAKPEEVAIAASSRDTPTSECGSPEVQSSGVVPIRKKSQEFDGKVSWEAYRIQFEMLADQNDWDEGQRAVQLATSLKGPALEVLGQLSKVDRNQYSALVEVLNRKYGTMCQSEVYRARLCTRVRVRGEPLQQLAQDLESTAFNAHINVEFYNSEKSIKYIDDYIHKGSDAAMFSCQQENSRDEVTQYQVGRYISSNEAFWRNFFFYFTLHQRHPAIEQLAVHLENGQSVYFTNANAAQLTQEPKDTTLTAFFKHCQVGPFVQILLYPKQTGSTTFPKGILEETSYNIDALARYVIETESKLLPDQQRAYNTIVDSSGGTGKIFVTKLLLTQVRQHKNIALAVAFSGIAATLLPGGRTVHSTFKLPLNLATSARAQTRHKC
uniref:ATP-dependent DNA helicase n=1 Tax=Octopus bimaculoides TaxID=37653 RepID=A0A0L8I7D2_OCTBM